MLMGEFSEGKQNEVELKEPSYEDFVELLNVIYPPCHKKINGMLFLFGI